MPSMKGHISMSFLGVISIPACAMNSTDVMYMYVGEWSERKHSVNAVYC